MSFKDKVERQKSARWTKASTANYDGEDWSDEEYGGEEYDAVTEESVPQHIVSDAKNDGEDDAHSFDADVSTPMINIEEKFNAIDLDESPEQDEYTKLVQDGEEEEEEYKPQTQTRFDPVVVEQEIQDIIPVDPTEQDESLDVATEQADGVTDVKSDQDGSSSSISQQEQKTYQFHEQTYDDYDDNNEDDDGSIGDSEVNAFPEDPQPLSQPQDDFEPIPNTNNNEEYIDVVPLSDDEDEYRVHKVDSGFEHYDDESEEEYQPRGSHFTSDLPSEELIKTSESNEEEQNESVISIDPIDAEDTKSLNKKNLTIDKPDPEIFPTALESPAVYNHSDTDSLHIHEPEPQVDDEVDKSNEITEASLPRDISAKSLNGEVMKEHAYLGELINTPDPNEIKNFEPQITEESSRPSSEEVRDSKFYSSAQDYFDDYQDEADEEHEEEHAVDHTLSKTNSNASSGSLSTGGVSIKSETAYRYSKFSDRSASFTNKSMTQSDIQSFNGSINNEEAKEPSSLNPAMSINFGQWRPNTESFRDQFISSSSTSAPPIPKLDNYTRNSNGEIIEDVNSIGASSIAGSGEIHLGEAILADSSMEGKEFAKDESHRTESNSLIPMHIPLNSPEASEKSREQFFQEKNPKPADVKSSTPKKLKKLYNMKQISTLDKSTSRIEKYRTARAEEANIENDLNKWISYALEKVEIVSYSSNVSTSHVRQAYAEAANVSHSGRRHNNLGSILNKSRVFHETSNTAQSFAKGIFSRGKKIIKNDH